MLNNQDEIDRFKDFQNAGGTKDPEAALVSADIINNASLVVEMLANAINDALDYEADGIQELPEQIRQISTDAQSASAAAKTYRDYVAMLCDPSSLEQIAIGSDIVCKLAGIPSDKPSLAIAPITTVEAVSHLSAQVLEIGAHTPDVKHLMTEINAAITPPPPPPPVEGQEPVVPPAPPLPEELKQQAMVMIESLKSFDGLVSNATTALVDFLNKSEQEKEKAVSAFYSCIQFTLLSNQKKNPIISDAVNNIYPD